MLAMHADKATKSKFKTKKIEIVDVVNYLFSTQFT